MVAKQNSGIQIHHRTCKHACLAILRAYQRTKSNQLFTHSHDFHNLASKQRKTKGRSSVQTWTCAQSTTRTTVSIMHPRLVQPSPHSPPCPSQNNSPCKQAVCTARPKIKRAHYPSRGTNIGSRYKSQKSESVRLRVAPRPVSLRIRGYGTERVLTCTTSAESKGKSKQPKQNTQTNQFSLFVYINASMSGSLTK